MTVAVSPKHLSQLKAISPNLHGSRLHEIKTALSRWFAGIWIAERVERALPMCTEPGMASIRPRDRERRRSPRAALRQPVRSPKCVQKARQEYGDANFEARKAAGLTAHAAALAGGLAREAA